MRTFTRTNLEAEVKYNNEVYTVNHGLSTRMDAGTTLESIQKEMKEKGVKCILVHVLSLRLKFKQNLHGKPYKPTSWIHTTKAKVQVISPDGFTIEQEPDHYPDIEAAEAAFNVWKNRYARQGYYSTASRGQIPLDKLKSHCTFAPYVIR